MKDLAAAFLTAEERGRVEAAVREAESRSGGEIVPVIAGASSSYPRAGALSATVLALAAAAPLDWALGSSGMAGYLECFGAAFLVLYGAVRLFPGLRKLAVPGREMDLETREAAESAFFRHDLHRTADRCGVLLYVSVFERRVHVLADTGVHDKAGAAVWDAVVAETTAGFARGERCQALCRAVARIGEVLAEHCPRRADDRDELGNLIVEG